MNQIRSILLEHGIVVAQGRRSLLDALAGLLSGMPPPKAVCPDLVIGFMSMPYVMRYNHFPY
ncbi:hypothetical protein C8J36_1161 [Rhizobium sp. PP-F2F-G48]|nr:hypothetical protein C8J36_1161 [Rhizobium sp. PP-F2F-G48]